MTERSTKQSTELKLVRLYCRFAPHRAEVAINFSNSGQRPLMVPWRKCIVPRSCSKFLTREEELEGQV